MFEFAVKICQFMLSKINKINKRRGGRRKPSLLDASNNTKLEKVVTQIFVCHNLLKRVQEERISTMDHSDTFSEINNFASL